MSQSKTEFDERARELVSRWKIPLRAILTVGNERFEELIGMIAAELQKESESTEYDPGCSNQANSKIADLNSLVIYAKNALEGVLASYEGGDCIHPTTGKRVEWMANDFLGTGDAASARIDQKNFEETVIEPCKFALKQIKMRKV